MTTSESISTRPAGLQTTSSTHSSNRSSKSSVPTGLAALAQRISQGISGAGDSDAVLADPFAEIFARMAVAEPVQATETPAEPVQANETESVDQESDTEATTKEVSETSAEIRDDSADETELVVAPVKSDSASEETNDLETEVVTAQLSEDNDDDSQSATQQVEVVVAEIESDDPVEHQEVVVEPEAALVAAPQVAAEVSRERESRREANDKTPIVSGTQLTNATTEFSQRETPTNQASTQLEQEPDHESGDAQQNPFDGRQTERRRYTNRSDQASQEAHNSDEPSPAARLGQRPTSEAKPSVESTNKSFSLSSSDAISNTGASASATSSVPSTTSTAPIVASTNTVSAVSNTSNGGNAGAKPALGSSALNAVTGPDTKPTSDVAKSSKATGADQLSAVQRAKLVQRVSRSFQHLGPDGGQIRMRLAPVELGSVRLDLRVQESRLRARMVTETEAASQVLREHLPQLRSSLESQGIRVDSIEIEADSTGDLNSEFFQNDSGQQKDQRSLPRHRRLSSQTPVDQSKPQQSISGPVIQVASAPNEGVDLQV